MVMIKLVRKEDAKNVRNYFMFLKLANIVLNVLESSGSGGIRTHDNRIKSPVRYLAAPQTHEATCLLCII